MQFSSGYLRLNFFFKLFKNLYRSSSKFKIEIQIFVYAEMLNQIVQHRIILLLFSSLLKSTC